MLKGLKTLKNMKWKPMITHVLCTLAYPVAKSFTIEHNRLLYFDNLLTIVSMLLLIAGILYNMSLNGLFDVSTYYVRRGVRSFTQRGEQLNIKQPIDEYLREARERREDAFNYPLFLGIVYLLISIFIGYVIL